MSLKHEVHRLGPWGIIPGRWYIAYYESGKQHRLDGPAEIWDDGNMLFFRMGTFIKEIDSVNI